MISKSSFKSSLSTSVKDRYTPGQLYQLIDVYCKSEDCCLFLEMIEPGTLTLQDVVRPTHWHMKVLHKGKIEYRDTSMTSLIELLYELVNQNDNP